MSTTQRQQNKKLLEGLQHTISAKRSTKRSREGRAIGGLCGSQENPNATWTSWIQDGAQLRKRGAGGTGRRGEEHQPSIVFSRQGKAGCGSASHIPLLDCWTTRSGFGVESRQAIVCSTGGTNSPQRGADAAGRSRGARRHVLLCTRSRTDYYYYVCTP